MIHSVYRGRGVIHTSTPTPSPPCVPIGLTGLRSKVHAASRCVVRPPEHAAPSHPRTLPPHPHVGRYRIWTVFVQAIPCHVVLPEGFIIVEARWYTLNKYVSVRTSNITLRQEHQEDYRLRCDITKISKLSGQPKI